MTAIVLSHSHDLALVNRRVRTFVKKLTDAVDAYVARRMQHAASEWQHRQAQRDLKRLRHLVHPKTS
jgi:hypothetical protein